MLETKNKKGPSVGLIIANKAPGPGGCQPPPNYWSVAKPNKEAIQQRRRAEEAVADWKKRVEKLNSRLLRLEKKITGTFKWR